MVQRRVIHHGDEEIWRRFIDDRYATAAAPLLLRINILLYRLVVLSTLRFKASRTV